MILRDGTMDTMAAMKQEYRQQECWEDRHVVQPRHRRPACSPWTLSDAQSNRLIPFSPLKRTRSSHTHSSRSNGPSSGSIHADTDASSPHHSNSGRCVFHRRTNRFYQDSQRAVHSGTTSLPLPRLVGTATSKVATA